MAVIKTNFADTPEKMLPIPPGMYEFQVTEASVEENKKKDGMNLVLKLKVVNDCPSKDRPMTDYVSLKGVEESQSMAAIKVKQIATAAGVDTAEGLDTDALVGKIVRATVINRTIKGDDGEDMQVGNIKAYVKP